MVPSLCHFLHDALYEVLGADIIMNLKKAMIDLSNYDKAFDIIHQIKYSTIEINNIGLRILGMQPLHVHDLDLKNSKMHKHSYFELFYVTENEMVLSIKDEDRVIQNGCFCLLHPNTVHSEFPKGKKGLKGIVLSWEFIEDGSGMNSRSNIDMENIRISLLNAHSWPVDDDGYILRELKVLLEMAQRGRKTIDLQLAFLEIVVKLSKVFNKEYVDESNKFYDDLNDNYIVREIINYIKKNYSENIEIRNITEKYPMSHSQILNLFKKQTGRTIIDYLNWTRLCSSKVLLTYTNDSIRKIANKVGYSSEQYFCRMFKKYFDVSPMQYRKK